MGLSLDQWASVHQLRRVRKITSISLLLSAPGLITLSQQCQPYPHSWAIWPWGQRIGDVKSDAPHLPQGACLPTHLPCSHRQTGCTHGPGRVLLPSLLLLSVRRGQTSYSYPPEDLSPPPGQWLRTYKRSLQGKCLRRHKAII